jgi:hypothetical protein
MAAIWIVVQKESHADPVKWRPPDAARSTPKPVTRYWRVGV